MSGVSLLNFVLEVTIKKKLPRRLARTISTGSWPRNSNCMHDSDGRANGENNVQSNQSSSTPGAH
jgi:hypothetical protein